MFWRVAALSTTSPVETILEKDSFTLEELFDEEEIIQECKSLNNRLINFLREKQQVQKMLRYIVEEPPENADNRRAFKFPFIGCEVFSCEIEVIFKTLLEDQELMDLLFSYLEPDRTHSTLLAGYFSKVVICLLARKTASIVEYIQMNCKLRRLLTEPLLSSACLQVVEVMLTNVPIMQEKVHFLNCLPQTHQEILRRLVDLIGITSIMEVLVRLVGADDHMYADSCASMQWLAETDVLEMIIDKLSLPNSSEAHTNAAETLCAITRLAPSALATKLASPSFVGRLFRYALDESQSKSTLVHALSVCISVLDPKRAMSITAANALRGHVNEPIFIANPETVDGMLQRLGDLLKLLDVSSDDKVLQTTYGELCPPLGKHRLKIVEFIAVLLRTGSENAQQELVRLGALQMIIQLFFDFPFNNALHHQVESIIVSCLESSNRTIIDHIVQDCNLVERLLFADKNPIVCDNENQPTRPTQGKVQPRVGNIGHVTRIANRLNQLRTSNKQIQGYLQGNTEWLAWESAVLSKRNTVENVSQWACGRPTTIHERTIDSDEDEFRDKDYDVSTMANNLSQVFRYGIFDNEDGEELHGSMDKDDEDVFFDDESAEMVVSQLRMGEDQDSARLRETMFTNTNWFAFQDDRTGDQSTSLVSSCPRDEESHASKTVMSTATGGSGSSDDEVVVGDDEELVDTATSDSANALIFDANFRSDVQENNVDVGINEKNAPHPVDDLSKELEKVDVSENLSFIQCVERNLDLFSVKSSDWSEWKDHTSFEGTSGRNPFSGNSPLELDVSNSTAADDVSRSASNGHDAQVKSDKETEKENMDASIVGTQQTKAEDSEQKKSSSLFEENVEVVGVEIEGTKRAMEHALKEGIVGEAGAIKRDTGLQSLSSKANDENGNPDFSDSNYWRTDLNPGAVHDDSL